MKDSTIHAVVVTIDGNAFPVDLDTSGPTPVYQQLQTYVGGTIDLVSLALNLDMWVNDEGHLLGLEWNPFATELAHHYYSDDRTLAYVGNVVFTGGSDEEGDTTSLTPLRIAQILQRVEDLCVEWGEVSER